MQLMIDTHVETPAVLRLVAEFLNSHAALLDAAQGNVATPAVAPVPTIVPPAYAGDGLFNPEDLLRAQHEMNMPNAAPAPFVPPPPAGNVVPFAPPPPVIPAMAPAAMPVAATPAVTSMTLPATPPAPVGVIADEFDSSGVPFDYRIHQKSRNKKKDGTWKVQKGLEADIVSAVMQELAPRIRKVAPSPVPLQSGSDTSSVASNVPAPILAPPPPVNPATAFGHTPLPVGAPAPVPLPKTQANFEANPQAFGAPTVQAPAAPAQDQGQAQAIDPFRALIRKITEAKNSGKITGEEVTQCVALSGAPSMQLLNNMQHLIPVVDSAIDVLLATR